MKQRIAYILAAFITLAAGIFMLLFAAKKSMLRATGGDFLVVILIYSCVKTFFPHMKPVKAGAGVLLFSVLVELLQLHFVKDFFNTGSLLIQLTLGSTFDPCDIAAYTAGVLFAAIADFFFHGVTRYNYDSQLLRASRYSE